MATQFTSKKATSKKVASTKCAPGCISRLLPKIIAISGTVLVTLTLGGYSWATPEGQPLVFTDPDVNTESIDYRHMSLYDLKQRRYHHIDADSEQVAINHIHHHEHWGWADGLNGWNSPYYYHYSRDSEPISFGQSISSGVTSVAATASILAIAVGTMYGISRAASLFWPYVGGAGLTAIELATNSLWSITGYRIANGYAVREEDFAHNPDALATVKEEQMFDRESNPTGRFLLLDQENWWGLTDYPLDVEITFSKYDADNRLIGDITVQVQRSVTNGLKHGHAHITTLKGHRYTEANTSYRVHYWQFYPEWISFDQWYHRPGRIVFQIENVQ